MSEVETLKGSPAPPKSGTPWALEHLPPFSPVAMRLVQLLYREDVHIRDVGEFISAEPVFSARVLQIANSPLFSMERQVNTISHAVVVIGLERVKGIALTRAMGDFAARTLKKNEALRVCWQSSLAGAVLAEVLARPCGMDPGFAYTAGLLRDIGRLALLVQYPEAYTNLLAVSQESCYDLVATERELFDIDHCHAGEWIAARMPLPLELCEAIAQHHDATLEPPFRAVHLVRIADRMADALGFSVLPASVRPAFTHVLEELPEQARVRMPWTPEELTKLVTLRIEAWT
jgi:HD-like signal output (HDOD) protein